ncbi:MAG: alpha-amylase family glycosyl hydrolase [Bacteroidales bacterium]
MNKIRIIIGVIISTFIFSCNTASKNADLVSNVKHAEWTKNAVIYEVNVRQFTKEGTFNAFASHIPRLKELGVDILWFMPIYPIGELDRKGTLGSYYSVKDYTSVNPEFGTVEEFKNVVQKAHDLGMKVIIDWVANHTSRDATWIKSNPDWYVIDSVTKTPVAPFNWTDVAKLDYNNSDIRKAMVDAMKFWLKETKINGFRCDVAFEVPTDFWDSTVVELRKVTPDLFMLAEAEVPELQVNAFDMYYSWKLHHVMNQIAQGKQNADSLRAYLVKNNSLFPKNTITMNFTSNHDENSWNGTEFERMGQFVPQMAALTFILPGMPLIYSGQEVSFNKRLEFFEKDSIVWNGNLSFTELYKSLAELRKGNPALNTPLVAKMEFLKSDNEKSIFTVQYKLDNNTVIAVFNFSDKPVSTNIKKIDKGEYSQFMSESKTKLKINQVFDLEPAGYKIFYKNEK